MLRRREIIHLYLTVNKKIKNFLLGKRNREFIIFLFFFSISGIFWLMQTLNNDYEIDIEIPVKLKDVPKNVVVSSGDFMPIKVRVKDKGTVLLNYMFAKKINPISFIFSDYKVSGSKIRIPFDDLEKKIQGSFQASTRFISAKPDNVEFVYSAGSSKRVPIMLVGKVTAANSYYICDTVYSQESVLVYAPAALLKKIHAAYTKPVVLTNITSLTRCRVKLNNVWGAKFVPDAVDLSFPVDIYMEKTIEVPIHGVNFPPGKLLRTFPSNVNVTFQVGMRYFRHIKPDDFIINVTYEDLLHCGSDKYDVKLKAIPSFVDNVRISPRKVDFLIESFSNGN